VFKLMWFWEMGIGEPQAINSVSGGDQILQHASTGRLADLRPARRRGFRG
jgi:hypothetical protein